MVEALCSDVDTGSLHFASRSSISDAGSIVHPKEYGQTKYDDVGFEVKKKVGR
jgi:hypothetical protein